MAPIELNHAVVFIVLLLLFFTYFFSFSVVFYLDRKIKFIKETLAKGSPVTSVNFFAVLIAGSSMKSQSHLINEEIDHAAINKVRKIQKRYVFVGLVALSLFIICLSFFQDFISFREN